jgi:hypothetical protein
VQDLGLSVSCEHLTLHAPGRSPPQVGTKMFECWLYFNTLVQSFSDRTGVFVRPLVDDSRRPPPADNVAVLAAVLLSRVGFAGFGQHFRDTTCNYGKKNVCVFAV